MSIEFPKLPYDVAALEPHVSSETLRFHHGKHHKGYVDKLNAAIPGTDYEDRGLTDIVKMAWHNKDSGIFNNAAQSWNHSFLWNSMSADGSSAPDGDLADAIERAFGNLETFRDRFKAAALGQFGSGWTWLVDNAGGLEIVSTANAETPIVGSAVPLITLDVWEHAYYLDYQNQRDRYVDAFLGDLINWDFAARNLESRQKAA